jgi:hypothetical protein
MKAMRLADSGATAVLVEENVPQPHPRRELLIQVQAGVTKGIVRYPTTHKKSGERRSRPYRDMSFPASLRLQLKIPRL